MSKSNLIEQFNKIFDALLNDPEKIPDYVAEDVLWINYVPDHLPYGGEYRGLAELSRLFGQYVDALDIGKIEFEEYFVAENNVLIVTGKECDSVVKSTGKHYDMPFAFVVRFNDEGKMVYLREHNDSYAMAEAFNA